MWQSYARLHNGPGAEQRQNVCFTTKNSTSFVDAIAQKAEEKPLPSMRFNEQRKCSMLRTQMLASVLDTRLERRHQELFRLIENSLHLQSSLLKRFLLLPTRFKFSCWAYCPKWSSCIKCLGFPVVRQRLFRTHNKLSTLSSVYLNWRFRSSDVQLYIDRLMLQFPCRSNIVFWRA